MRLFSFLIVFSTFAIAAILSLVAASFAADVIEDISQRSVQDELTRKNMTWAKVHAEGLEVFVAGVAPTEADRFRAISAAGHIVDAARVIDNMQVVATADIAPPRFSVEILRNDSGIQLIGLLPGDTDRPDILRRLKRLEGKPEIVDFLETADYTPPEGWDKALSFAVSALELLPRAKISVDARRVSITAMSDSAEQRNDLKTQLNRRAPADLEVALNISAPRPVITPFTLRYLVTDEGARFDACSADTAQARNRILKAAIESGFTGSQTCTIGLGVPTPSWAEAVEIAIRGLHELGGGSVTFSDADITLVARTNTEQALFDRVVGEIETSLPEVFALHSTLPVVVETEEGAVPEFTATLSPEGLLQMRGRLRDDVARDTTESYALARFGSAAVHMAARLDDTLPATWSVRVMAGLDALSNLHNGVLRITPDAVSVSGTTGNPDANAEISRALAERLSQTDHFSIDVAYVEQLDPVAQLPTPEECVASIETILAERKIVFEPGSGTLDTSAGPIIDDIATILKECGQIRLEIQGHTDSQGREEMNQALSQTRAQSVLNALHERRILTSSYLARGYGESEPIADNGTQEGREANRRIEFVLTRAEADDPDGDEDHAHEGTEPATPENGDAAETAETPSGDSPQTPEDSGDAPAQDASQAEQETSQDDTN